MNIVKIDPATGLGIGLATREGEYPCPDNLPLNHNGQRLALVDGAITRIWDLRGFSAYGGEDGRTPTSVPNTQEMLGKSWDDLAARGYRQSPKPETAAEKRTREAAEAEAAAEAERVRILGLSASSVQFAQACAMAGIITKAEAVAWASAGTLPAALAAAISAIPDDDERFAAEIKAAGAVSYERASPLVAGLGQAMGKTAAELDALFVLAVGL